MSYYKEKTWEHEHKIKALEKEVERNRVDIRTLRWDFQEKIASLPDNLIRCKDCTYGHTTQKGLMACGFWQGSMEGIINEKDFCSKARKRKEE